MINNDSNNEEEKQTKSSFKNIRRGNLSLMNKRRQNSKSKGLVLSNLNIFKVNNEMNQMSPSYQLSQQNISSIPNGSAKNSHNNSSQRPLSAKKNQPF